MVEEEYKGYKICGDGTFGMKVIKPIGKGSIPHILRGSYTKTEFAKRAIDLQLNMKKVTKNGPSE